MSTRKNTRRAPAPATITVPERRRELVPLELIVDNPHNVRFELGDLTELVDSIQRVGLLKDPLLVPLPDGTYLPIDGNRRRAASALAGLTAIYALIADDLATEDGMPTAEQYAAMLEAAIPQEELTRHERAAAYVQMCAFDGMTPTKVATRLGIDPAEVKEAVAASKLPAEVQAVFFARDLTLDDALALAELEADPKRYAKIVSKLSTGSGSYVITEERHRRALAEAKQRARTELAEADIRIVADPGWGFPRNTIMQPVSNLRDKAGRAIGQAKHQRCPGHAAFLRSTGRSQDPIEITHVCTDPEAYGHTLREPYTGREQALGKAAEAALTPEQLAERDEADEAARIAWATACDTRREWLGQQVRAKVLHADLARAALGASKPYGRSAVYALAMLTGKPEGENGYEAEQAYTKLAQSTAVANLHRHTVAYYVADQEDSATRLDVADRSPWQRNRAESVAAWLTCLVAIGYLPTEAEQQLIDQHPAEAVSTDENTEVDAVA
jgi:ParB/RepB/Spo0J family partition protein